MWAFSAVSSSADEAMIDLLAGLENDGYQMGHHKTLSHHHSVGSFRNSQNSDDEENEPQCEKEEMELSLLMSQRWDSSIEEPGTKRRYIRDLLLLICTFLPNLPSLPLCFKCVMRPVSCREVPVDSTGKIYADLGIKCSC